MNGVGRNTAERLVVELRDKLAFVALSSDPPAPAEQAARGRRPRMLQKSERYDDAVAALITLGYSPAQASDAVRRVSPPYLAPVVERPPAEEKSTES